METFQPVLHLHLHFALHYFIKSHAAKYLTLLVDFCAVLQKPYILNATAGEEKTTPPWGRTPFTLNKKKKGYNKE